MTASVLFSSISTMSKKADEMRKRPFDSMTIEERAAYDKYLLLLLSRLELACEALSGIRNQFQRQVIVLRHLKLCLSFDEIAEALQSDRRTVKAAYHDAMIAMNNKIAGA